MQLTFILATLLHKEDNLSTLSFQFLLVSFVHLSSLQQGHATTLGIPRNDARIGLDDFANVGRVELVQSEGLQIGRSGDECVELAWLHAIA